MVGKTEEGAILTSDGANINYVPLIIFPKIFFFPPSNVFSGRKSREHVVAQVWSPHMLYPSHHSLPPSHESQGKTKILDHTVEHHVHVISEQPSYLDSQ
jgi:hypothetical protein